MLLVTGSQSRTLTPSPRELHKVTVHCSPLVAFSCPPTPESITCLPLSGSWGAVSTLTNRWNTDSRELWDPWGTQSLREGQTEICLLAKSYTLCDLHSNNLHALYVFLNSLNVQSDSTAYISDFTLPWNWNFFFPLYFLLSSLFSPRRGAPENTSGKSGRHQLVVMGDLVELLTELCQRLPHPSAILRRARGKECPRRMPWLACGLPGL